MVMKSRPHERSQLMRLGEACTTPNAADLNHAALEERLVAGVAVSRAPRNPLAHPSRSFLRSASKSGNRAMGGS